jgi:hypothetical protein
LAALYRDLESRIETEIVTRGEIAIDVPLPLESAAKELADFMGQLLVDARDKMLGRILVHDGTAAFDSNLSALELKKHFVIFVSGGGAKSGWYNGIVNGIHQQRNLVSHGIMNYRCELLQPSPDFDKSTGLRFERFVIAYGLTIDAANLENLKARLPAQLRPGQYPPMAKPVSIAYEDSKDALT